MIFLPIGKVNAVSTNGGKHPSYLPVTAPRAVTHKASKLSESMPTLLPWLLMESDDHMLETGNECGVMKNVVTWVSKSLAMRGVQEEIYSAIFGSHQTILCKIRFYQKHPVPLSLSLSLFPYIASGSINTRFHLCPKTPLSNS